MHGRNTARAATLPDSILVIVAVMRYREFPVSLCCSRDRISPRPTYSSARSRDSGSSLLLRPRMRGVVSPDELLGRDVRVLLGGREALVAEQLLDRAQVGARVQHVGGEGVAQRVGRGLEAFGE